EYYCWLYYSGTQGSF
nr:immunoglobulin light chain junction region [Macaca mulatta]MOX77627.1 immunoglobulin light chain junction region [Macaca mulatta]MOX77778.1 immunoglobulin light chain junction region [Macaca mulatta]MOX77907.1 immunoglobulin light chain junction region [Macaca mulatta]MOX77974.1 immunoglobulin light chain junction region [Macaca mulatta]